MDLVLKLRELRHLRGLSQKDVARLSGVGEKTLSSFESGRRVGAIKLSQLVSLLRVYGVTEEQFFGHFLEELFDPDAISRRTREERLIARLADLPQAAQDALFERFELMIDSACAVHFTASRKPPSGGSSVPATPAPRHAAAA